MVQAELAAEQEIANVSSESEAEWWFAIEKVKKRRAEHLMKKFYIHTSKNVKYIEKVLENSNSTYGRNYLGSVRN